MTNEEHLKRLKLNPNRDNYFLEKGLDPLKYLTGAELIESDDGRMGSF